MGRGLIPAQVTQLPSGLWDVSIREVGQFTLPHAVLHDKMLLASAMEVVSVAMGPGQTYVLEAAGGVVTTEMLAESVRLRILPKVGLNAVDRLIHWSQHDPTQLARQLVPLDMRPWGSLLDILAQRLLVALEEVFRGGWMLQVEPRTVVLDDIRGDVDPMASLEYLYGRQELRFVQRVLVTDHDATPNRVLRTALELINSAGARLDAELLARARSMLTAAPEVTPYASAGEALAACLELLGHGQVEGARGYYYPALLAAEQVLSGAQRADGAGAYLQDVPLRVAMPTVFEGAVRNLAASALRGRFRVGKEKEGRLYQPGAPKGFDPGLEPDIVVRPLGQPDRCTALLDAKYKEGPAAGDHYQLAAYAQVYGASLAGFVTVTDNPREAGEWRRAQSHQGVDVFEYSLYAADIEASLKTFGAWLQRRVGR